MLSLALGAALIPADAAEKAGAPGASDAIESRHLRLRFVRGDIPCLLILTVTFFCRLVEDFAVIVEKAAPDKPGPDVDDLTKRKAINMKHQSSNATKRHLSSVAPKEIWKLAACAIATFIVTSCTLTPSGREGFTLNQNKAPRPSRILVHDFAVIPGDLPADAPIGARLAVGASLTQEQIAKDRELAAEMTTQLVAAIREMGLPAERAVSTEAPQVNEVVVRGCFVSKHESSSGVRQIVGFDFGATELLAMLEAFQTTPQGVGHRLAARDNTNGIIMTSATKIQDKATARAALDGWSKQAVREIATSCKTVFQEQGWSN